MKIFIKIIFWIVILFLQVILGAMCDINKVPPYNSFTYGAWFGYTIMIIIGFIDFVFDEYR